MIFLSTMNSLPFCLPFCALMLLGFLHAELPLGSPVQKRLGELKAGFESSVQREVGEVHAQAVRDLDAKYSAALDRAITSNTQAGKLDEALALRAEKQRIEANKPLPPDDTDLAEVLKPLRTVYRTTLARLEADRGKRLAPLRARYDQVLAAYFAELMKAGDLDGALAAKAVRESLAPTGGKPADDKPGVPKESSEAAGAPKHDPGAARRIIDWIASGNGSFRITTDGGKTKLGFNRDSLDKLPKGKWELLEIQHGTGLGQSVPREPFPWDALDAVPRLRQFHIRQGPVVTAEELRHLHGLAPVLEVLNLGMLDIQQSLWEALPVFPKVFILVVGEPDRPCNQMDESLLELLVQRFPNLTELHWCNRFMLTDKGVDTLLRWKGMKRMSMNCDLTAESVAKLAQFKSLQKLVIHGKDSRLDPAHFSSLKSLETIDLFFAPQTRNLIPEMAKLPLLSGMGFKGTGITAADLQPFTSHKRLTGLVLTGNPTIDDNAMDVVVTMKAVRYLDLRGTSVTDEGLAKLRGAKSLTEVKCADTKSTPEGAEALRKVLPKCKVTDK